MLAAAASFFDGWSADALGGLSTVGRPLLQSAMKQAMAEGYSANRFLTELKSFGYGMRRQDFLALWKSTAGIAADETLAHRVMMDFVPTGANSPTAVFGKVSGLYHKVVLTSTKVVDGERITSRKTVVVRGPEGQTVGQIITQATNLASTVEGGSPDLSSGRFLAAQYAGSVMQQGSGG